MAYQFDDFQKYGKEQLEVMTTSSSSLAKGWQTIAAESSEYSKKSFENGSAFFEKLLGAKSFESAIQNSIRIYQDVFRGARWVCNENDSVIQIHSEYAKTSYEGFVAQAKKMGELYSDLAKEVFKPIETAITKVQTFNANDARKSRL